MPLRFFTTFTLAALALAIVACSGDEDSGTNPTTVSATPTAEVATPATAPYSPVPSPTANGDDEETTNIQAIISALEGNDTSAFREYVR